MESGEDIPLNISGTEDASERTSVTSGHPSVSSVTSGKRKRNESGDRRDQGSDHPGDRVLETVEDQVNKVLHISDLCRGRKKNDLCEELKAAATALGAAAKELSRRGAGETIRALEAERARLRERVAILEGELASRRITVGTPRE